MAQLLVQTSGSHHGSAPGWRMQTLFCRAPDLLRDVSTLEAVLQRAGGDSTAHDGEVFGMGSTGVHSRRHSDSAAAGWSWRVALLVSLFRPRKRKAFRSVQRTAIKLHKSFDGDYKALVQELNKHATLGNITQAERVWDHIEDRGIPTQASTRRALHNTLLKVYANSGDLMKAQTWMQKMSERGIVPNAKGIGKVLEAAAKSGNVAVVESMFEDAVAAIKADKNFDKNEVRATYCMLMDVYAKHGYWQKAVTTLHNMIDSKVVPDVKDYNTCINACAKAVLPAQASALEKEMSELGLVPNLKTYTGIVLANRENLKEAEQVFQEMIKKTIAPDVTAYTSLINVCAKAARSDRSEDTALKALGYVREMKSVAVEPNARTYCAVIDTLAMANYIDDAKTLLHRKIDIDGIAFNDAGPWTTILTAYNKTKQFDEAEKWSAVMQSRTVLDLQAWTAIIDCYAAAGRVAKALSTLEAMQNARVRPSVVTHHSIVKAYARGGDVEGGFAWLKAMPKKGFKPSPVPYTTLLQARETSTDMAERLLRHMAANGVRPNDWCKKASIKKLGANYSTLVAELNLEERSYSVDKPKNEGYLQRRRGASLEREHSRLRAKSQED